MTTPRNSLFNNAVFYLIYNILNIAFPFITGVYVARVLIPADIGQVETARNLASYFITFSLLGIPTYALRECSKLRNDKDRLSKLYSELLIINAISVACFLTLYIALIFSVEVYRDHLPLFCITGIGIALNFVYVSWLYEGLERFDFISIRNIVFKIICFVLLIIFVRGPTDVYKYALISVVGTAGNYIINFVFSKKYVSFTFRGLSFKKHLKPIFILAFTYLAIELYSMVDITMISWICPKENVAYYSYATRIKSILLTAINTFTIIVVPRLASYYKDKKTNEYNNLLGKVLHIIVFLSIPAIIGIWFVSDYLLPLIYGEPYYHSSSVLKILSFVLLISPVGYLLGSRVCLTTGHEDKMIIPLAVGALINILLNMILIPLLMENGAAIASVFSEIVVALIYFFITRNYYSIRFSFGKIVKTIIPAIAILTFLTFTLLMPFSSPSIKCLTQIIGSILIYFSVALIMREESSLLVLKKIKSLVRRT